MSWTAIVWATPRISAAYAIVAPTLPAPTTDTLLRCGMAARLPTRRGAAGTAGALADMRAAPAGNPSRHGTGSGAGPRRPRRAGPGRRLLRGGAVPRARQPHLAPPRVGHARVAQLGARGGDRQPPPVARRARRADARADRRRGRGDRPRRAGAAGDRVVLAPAGHQPPRRPARRAAGRRGAARERGWGERAGLGAPGPHRGRRVALTGRHAVRRRTQVDAASAA